MTPFPKIFTILFLLLAPLCLSFATPAPQGGGTPGVVEFTIKTPLAYDKTYDGPPFSISVCFTCCESGTSFICGNICVTLSIETGDTPASMSTKLAAAINAAANCPPEAKGTKKSVRLTGVPVEANPDAPKDSPKKFPPTAHENQGDPYVEMRSYAL